MYIKLSGLPLLIDERGATEKALVGVLITLLLLLPAHNTTIIPKKFLQNNLATLSLYTVKFLLTHELRSGT